MSCPSQTNGKHGLGLFAMVGVAGSLGDTLRHRVILFLDNGAVVGVLMGSLSRIAAFVESITALFL